MNRGLTWLGAGGLDHSTAVMVVCSPRSTHAPSAAAAAACQAGDDDFEEGGDAGDDCLQHAGDAGHDGF